MGRRIEDKDQTAGAGDRPATCGRCAPIAIWCAGCREPDRQRLQVRPAPRDDHHRGRCRRRWTTARQRRRRRDLRVRDEGAGIPAAYRQLIFEKYGRVEGRAGGASARQPRAGAGVLPPRRRRARRRDLGRGRRRRSRQLLLRAAPARARCRCRGAPGRRRTPTARWRSRLRASRRSARRRWPGRDARARARLYAEYRQESLGAHRPAVPLAAAGRSGWRRS